MNNNFLKYSIVLCLTAFVSACNSSNKHKDDTPQSGTINISVDESFKPVIEEQIKVYESTYPDAHIKAFYKSEVECFRDFQKDSTRLIIVSRGLTEDEIKQYRAQLNYKPNFEQVAYDAVAVIVNINSKDSVFTIAQLNEILSGKNNMVAIMDGNNATSTVKYLQDSILKGQPFGKNAVGVKGNEEVLQTVAKTPNSIGFVGFGWVGDTYDPKQQEQLKKIRLALIECKTCEKGTFAKPSQASITYAQYPLARPLFYILKENALGLGSGFTTFMTLERGQLIFKRSFLIPAQMNFKVRTVK